PAWRGCWRVGPTPTGPSSRPRCWPNWCAGGPGRPIRRSCTSTAPGSRDRAPGSARVGDPGLAPVRTGAVEEGPSGRMASASIRMPEPALLEPGRRVDARPPRPAPIARPPNIAPRAAQTATIGARRGSGASPLLAVGAPRPPPFRREALHVLQRGDYAVERQLRPAPELLPAGAFERGEPPVHPLQVQI